MFPFKSLPQGLFGSEYANSNKLISRCYHAGLGLRDTVKSPQVAEKQNKARTTVIANKHQIQNVPKLS